MTDPNDDTDLHPIPDPAVAPAPVAAAASPGAMPASPITPPPMEPPRTVVEPQLAADPNRPADSGWREPAWFPPRERDRRPSMAAVVVGLVLIGIGLWFFLDRTLGVDLPRIQWSTIWPVILIVIGAVILLRSFQRKS